MPARRCAPARRGAAALFGSLLLLGALSCSSDPVAGQATIGADPNPVPMSDADSGTTTVTWNTGGDSWGQVYLFVEGQPEALFSEGPTGSEQVPWIGTDTVYEFRLYAGRNREARLASVTVTRGTAPDPAAVSAFILSHYAALAGLVVVAYGVGRRLTLRCEYRSGWEQFVMCTGLGLGVVALLLFVLGLLGGLYRSFVLSGIILLVVACVAVWKELFQAWVSLPRTRRLYGLLAAPIAAIVLLPALAVPLDPPTAFDSLMYHLPYARSYVESHAVSPVLSVRYPVFPQVNEMLFTLALLFVDDVAAQLTQFLMLVLIGLTLYAWGSRSYSPRVGLWAASLWLASPIVPQLAGYAYVDLGLTCFATLSAYAAFGGPSADRLTGSVLAGAFAGLAAGSKYSGLLFAAALGVTALARTFRQRNPRLVVGFALAALATGAPWYVYNAYHSGNPVFPFLAPVFGSGFWSPGDAASNSALVNSYGDGTSLRSLLRLPWSLSFGDFPQRAEISPVYFASLPVLLLAAAVGYRVRALVLLSVAFILFWFWTAAVVRYLLPVLPLLSLAIAAVVDGLLRRVPLRARRPGAVLAGACALALVLPTWQPEVLRLDPARWPPATKDARDLYLRRLASYRAYQFVNDARGSDYTIYGLYSEGMGYYARGKAMGDWFGPARFTRIRQRLWDGQSLYNELRELGADYFLVRTDRYVVQLPDDQFFRTHFKPVYTEPEVQLFELTGDPSTAPRGSTGRSF